MAGSVKGMLRAEMKRQSMTYEQLAEKLAELGRPTRRERPANKVSRGGFSAVFFVQCLKAMGAREVRLDDG